MQPGEEVYSREYCEAVLQTVREDPRGFLRGVRQRCKNVKYYEVVRSLRAWNIPS